MSLTDVVVGGSLLIAAVLVGVRSLGLDLKKPLGSPKWDYSESWASTFTVGSGILGTLLSTSGVVPEDPTLLSNAVYGALSVLFAVVAGAAPLIYVASQTAQGSEQPHGVVGGFLLASAVTFWGALGELATLGLLIGEIMLKGTLSVLAVRMWIGVVVVAAILMTVYLWKGIQWRVSGQIPMELRSAGNGQPRDWSIL